MLHSTENNGKTQFTPLPLNSTAPIKTVPSPIEQATIGRTVVIKGEISGSESLYIDGRVEGTINLPGNRLNKQVHGTADDASHVAFLLQVLK